MLKYFISIALILVFINLSAQQDSLHLDQADSLTRHQPVKIRFGWDAGKFIWTKIQNGQSFDGYISVNFYKNYALVFEAGTENHLTEQSLLTYQTNGKYFKTGIDYNLYDNWLDMQNEINIGFRYGYSSFDYLLTRYRINQPDAIYTPVEKTTHKEFNNQSAGWLELSSNIQVEIWKHLYLGYAVSVKYLLSYQKPENFDTSYIPGFFKRNSFSNFGFGMQYFISYQFIF